MNLKPTPKYDRGMNPSSAKILSSAIVEMLREDANATPEVPASRAPAAISAAIIKSALLHGTEVTLKLHMSRRAAVELIERIAPSKYTDWDHLAPDRLKIFGITQTHNLKPGEMRKYDFTIALTHIWDKATAALTNEKKPKNALAPTNGRTA